MIQDASRSVHNFRSAKKSNQSPSMMVEIASEAQPRREFRGLYDELYEIFERAYAALEDASVFRRLAGVDSAQRTSA